MGVMSFDTWKKKRKEEQSGATASTPSGSTVKGANLERDFVDPSTQRDKQGTPWSIAETVTRNDTQEFVYDPDTAEWEVFSALTDPRYNDDILTENDAETIEMYRRAYGYDVNSESFAASLPFTYGKKAPSLAALAAVELDKYNGYPALRQISNGFSPRSFGPNDDEAYRAYLRALNARLRRKP